MRKIIILSLAITTLAATMSGQQLNRGIGQYPGSPDENFAPIAEANGSYRNLALYRTVYQSSAWDFNLTSQLLTDGFIDTGAPALLNVTTPDGAVPPHKREAAIDGNEWTCNILMGADTWLQYDWQGMSVNANEVEMVCSMAYREQDAGKSFDIKLLTSQDGKRWKVADQWSGKTLPGEASPTRVHSDPNKNNGNDEDLLPTRNIDHRFRVAGGAFSHMRIEMRMPGAVHWTITELKMRANGRRARGILPATHFSSTWRSLGTVDEWITIDLGNTAVIDKVRLHWLNKATKGDIQLSDDNETWRTAATLSGQLPQNGTEEIGLGNASARYLRVNMAQSMNHEPFSLTEVEVMGTGGVTYRPHSDVDWINNQWMLDGGDWRIQRASEVAADGKTISTSDYQPENWLLGTVPSTVLSSYVNAGALPDMNYDDNLMLSSESFFGGDFWYRRTFDRPRGVPATRAMLNLDGINWKAEVWFNGTMVGKIDGAFQRGKFDITPFIKDENNALAIRIIANDNPGGVKVKTERNTDYNGGILGADNPTFHATVGWDWISTIRGRDIGIWDDVYLTFPGDVTVSDPMVTTTLSGDKTLATITPAVMLTNHSSHPVTGTLSGKIGDINFEKQVTIGAGQMIEAEFSPQEFSQLRGQQMQLWWPNGYGEPYLYDANFTFAIDGRHSDEVNFKAGIREVTTTDKDTQLCIYVNGRRIEPLGGNWAFSENNLNYRGREYDAAVRHHKEMNYNMIRNWVGMTGDKEFYEACDRYGIMVWQDFWLANPADGPDPDDEEMFMHNAKDMIMKIRNHPSIGIYCGRNEGYPPKSIDDGLRKAIAAMHPGLDYISSSADDGVSGHGPYNALSAEEYFTRQTGKLHTERGMPNVMTSEGLKRTLKAEHLWPQNLYWGRHDFTMEGAQRGASFNQLISDNFYEPIFCEDFCDLAQWINYEGYRAMYEAEAQDRMGLLIWMSHPCWPSMVWQTYDYYLEPTAAYFGVKHACEPLHVQWNPVTGKVMIVNRCRGSQQGKVRATAIGLDGKTLWDQTKSYSCHEDETTNAMAVEKPEGLEGVYFLRLTLTDSNGDLASQNDYVIGTEKNNRKALMQIGHAEYDATLQHYTQEGSTRRAAVTLENTGHVPAVMMRLNLMGNDGEQILPVIYSDNYLHLMPGESRDIDIEWKVEDARGTQPQIVIQGHNTAMKTITIQ